MKRAIFSARLAEKRGEVPVGALIVDENGAVIAEACNQTIALCDPTAHAEILAMRQAAVHKGNYRLLNTTLYATVEPCAMCMGAAIHARVARVVFGVHDPKWGAAGSLFDFSEKGLFNHPIEITSGLCEAECRQLLVDFFRSKRNHG
ncbi:MAG: tRNA adenosine(34) deaminase TadA [Thermodesulfobacteriota bacterium]